MNLLNVAATLAVAVLLSGCTPAPVRVAPVVGSTKDDGYVLAHMLVNADSVAGYGISALELEAADGKTEYPLVYVSYMTFAGWVPPGTYKLKDVVAGALVVNRSDSFKVDVGDSLANLVTVRAGRVTNLQTLIYQPLGGDNAILIPVNQSIDVAATVKAVQPAAAPALLAAGVDTEDLQEVFPVRVGNGQTRQGGADLGALAALITEASDASMKRDQELRWNDAKTTGDLIALAKRSTTVLFGGYFDADGGALFGSGLGQILKRDASGTWTYTDTGRLDSVIDVVEDGNTLLASFADGPVRYSMDSGAHWVDLKLPASMSNVYRIYPQGSQKFLLVDEGEGGQAVVGVYSLQGLQDPIVTQLHTVKLGFKRSWVPDFFVAMADGHLLLGQDDQDIDIYDIKAGTWESQHLKSEYSQMRFDDAERYVDLIGANGVFGSDYMSEDGGEHWTEVRIPLTAFNVHFLSPTAALGLDIDVGAFSGTTRTMNTNDAGKHWLRGKPMEEPCVSFFVLDKTQQYVCTTQTGKIISTKDGQTWTVERAAY